PRLSRAHRVVPGARARSPGLRPLRRRAHHPAARLACRTARAPLAPGPGDRSLRRRRHFLRRTHRPAPLPGVARRRPATRPARLRGARKGAPRPGAPRRPPAARPARPRTEPLRHPVAVPAPAHRRPLADRPRARTGPRRVPVLVFGRGAPRDHGRGARPLHRSPRAARTPLGRRARIDPFPDARALGRAGPVPPTGPRGAGGSPHPARRLLRDPERRPFAELGSAGRGQPPPGPVPRPRRRRLTGSPGTAVQVGGGPPPITLIRSTRRRTLRPRPAARPAATCSLDARGRLNHEKTDFDRSARQRAERT